MTDRNNSIPLANVQTYGRKEDDRKAELLRREMHKQKEA